MAARGEGSSRAATSGGGYTRAGSRAASGREKTWRKRSLGELGMWGMGWAVSQARAAREGSVRPAPRVRPRARRSASGSSRSSAPSRAPGAHPSTFRGCSSTAPARPRRSRALVGSGPAHLDLDLAPGYHAPSRECSTKPGRGGRASGPSRTPRPPSHPGARTATCRKARPGRGGMPSARCRRIGAVRRKDPPPGRQGVHRLAPGAEGAGEDEVLIPFRVREAGEFPPRPFGRAPWGVAVRRRGSDSASRCAVFGLCPAGRCPPGRATSRS